LSIGIYKRVLIKRLVIRPVLCRVEKIEISYILSQFFILRKNE